MRGVYRACWVLFLLIVGAGCTKKATDGPAVHDLGREGKDLAEKRVEPSGLGKDRKRVEPKPSCPLRLGPMSQYAPATKTCNGVTVCLYSVQNCGACGRRCKPVPPSLHQEPFCVFYGDDLVAEEQDRTFECKPGCQAGYADLDRLKKNGCETKLPRDLVAEREPPMTLSGRLAGIAPDGTLQGVQGRSVRLFCEAPSTPQDPMNLNAQVCRYELVVVDANGREQGPRTPVEPPPEQPSVPVAQAAQADTDKPGFLGGLVGARAEESSEVPSLQSALDEAAANSAPRTAHLVRRAWPPHGGGRWVVRLWPLANGHGSLVLAQSQKRGDQLYQPTGKQATRWLGDDRQEEEVKGRFFALKGGELVPVLDLDLRMDEKQDDDLYTSRRDWQTVDQDGEVRSGVPILRVGHYGVEGWWREVKANSVDHVMWSVTMGRFENCLRSKNGCVPQEP